MSSRLPPLLPLFFAASLQAQNNGVVSLDALIKQLDTDGDGRVSKAEATGQYADRFAQWDADGDGYASREEIRKYRLSNGIDDEGKRAGTDRTAQRARPAATAAVLKEPGDWRLENLPMPPGFAPEITLRGSEEIRFAPGMFKTDASDYFTCVIAITADDAPTIGAEELKDFLQKYYRGLSGNRARRTGGPLDASQLTASVKALAGNRFEATMDFLDSFNDGRRITLNIEAQTVAKSAEKKTLLFLLVSPSAKDSPVWKTLHEIGARLNPSPPKSVEPAPTVADISYGPHEHQLIDIYLPKKGEAPYPAILWFGGIWKASKHPANLGFFDSKGIAVIAVETRTMEDATAAKEKVPVSYVQSDAIRAVQFVRHNAVKWNLDPKHLATGGGSQGAQPALFVGCSRDQANAASNNPVERESSLVTCVAAYRCQPTFDPKRMQEWVPEVKWGAPAFGMSFEDSLKHREELLPVIKQWSPDYLLHKEAAPMFFENEWGQTKPDDITKANYDVHCPRWALGFQKLALAAGAECHVKFPDRPADDPAKDIWDFVARRLRP